MRSKVVLFTAIGFLIAAGGAFAGWWVAVDRVRSYQPVADSPGQPADPAMMRGSCPLCGGPWYNTNGWNGTIPEKLPKPQSAEWVDKLQDILARERLSQVQYEADSRKYNAHMPYMMIIPQEADHIQWITGLFNAYGIKPEAKTPEIEKSSSLEDAYSIGQSLESELILRYEWLISNAEDETSKQVLDTILLQTRMHQAMFTHALQMQGMGMGSRGGMGHGPMHGR
jgi:hypothetical protein